MILGTRLGLAMRQWANYPQVESSARPLFGIPPGQIPVMYPGLRADGLLTIPVTRTGGRLVVRPLGIGLIVLALAIVLWGIGYRLSLYRPHPDPSARVSVAKLWLGPRKAVCFTSPTKRLALASRDSQLVGVQNHASQSGLDAILVISAAPASNVRVHLLLRTLRSPPILFL
jgi:hypothetical protein